MQGCGFSYINCTPLSALSLCRSLQGTITSRWDIATIVEARSETRSIAWDPQLKQFLIGFSGCGVLLTFLGRYSENIVWITTVSTMKSLWGLLCFLMAMSVTKLALQSHYNAHKLKSVKKGLAFRESAVVKQQATTRGWLPCAW